MNAYLVSCSDFLFGFLQWLSIWLPAVTSYLASCSDFLFGILQWLSIWLPAYQALSEKECTLKERICSQDEQNLLFRVLNYSQTSMARTSLGPWKLSRFDCTVVTVYDVNIQLGYIRQWGPWAIKLTRVQVVEQVPSANLTLLYAEPLKKS